MVKELSCSARQGARPDLKRQLCKIMFENRQTAALRLFCATSACSCWHNEQMSDFVSPGAVKAAIKAHLVFHSQRPNAFVDVQLIPGGKQSVYVITIDASLLPPVRALLEDRLGRRCPYVEGSFLVYDNEVSGLLGR